MLKEAQAVRFSISPVMSHLEAILIRTAAYMEKQCMPISNSDTDSTVISNSDGSQNFETAHWDFEGTVGDKIRNGNAFGD